MIFLEQREAEMWYWLIINQKKRRKMNWTLWPVITYFEFRAFLIPFFLHVVRVSKQIIYYATVDYIVCNLAINPSVQ